MAPKSSLLILYRYCFCLFLILAVAILFWTSKWHQYCSETKTILCLLVKHIASQSPQQKKQDPPNIIMIMIDDLGWNGLTLHGNNNEVRNPTLEKMAAESILLENYYVYKFCSPSRASFLTGRIPGHGIWEINPSDTAMVGVNLKATMIPALLKEKANYSTHQIGKWHQGFYAPQYTPRGRGFDTSFGFLMGGSDHFNSCHACVTEIPPPDYTNHSQTCPAPNHGGAESGCFVTCPEEGGIDLYRNDGPAIGENGTYTSYLWSKEAERIINENKGTNPMFMYLALHNVHEPVEAPPEFLQEYPLTDYNETSMPRRYYNAMTFSVDSVISNVTNALRKNGMLENTVIVVSTDNGGTFEHGRHGHPVTGSSNFPLRGYKYSYFEGGVRGLGLIYSPLLPKSRQGTKTKSLLHVSDWYVTFCKLAGIEDCNDELSNEAPLDGIDVWKLLTETEDAGDNSKNRKKQNSLSPPRPASSWVSRGGPGKDEVLLGVGNGRQGMGTNYVPLGQGALRTGDMKLIVGSVQQTADGWSAQYPGSTAARGPPKSPSSFCGSNGNKKRPCLLFNITSDPTEEHNLVGQLPQLTKKLFDRFNNLVKAMNVSNGDDETYLSDLVWNGAYHVPRVTDKEACIKMRETGFWAPWKEHPSTGKFNLRQYHEPFPKDGPPAQFDSNTLLI